MKFNEGRAARGGVTRSQSDDGASRFGQTRRPDPVRSRWRSSNILTRRIRFRRCCRATPGAALVCEDSHKSSPAISHPLIVPRVREYLEHEFKLDEPTRIKWCQHWHTAALTALEVHLKDAATAIATATRSRSSTSASRAKPWEQNSSRSTPRRFRISPGSLIRSRRSTPSPARTR